MLTNRYWFGNIENVANEGGMNWSLKTKQCRSKELKSILRNNAKRKAKRKVYELFKLSRKTALTHMS
jgi:hypothetical protein